MKIYTRKGDDGTTGLWYGGRVGKASPPAGGLRLRSTRRRRRLGWPARPPSGAASCTTTSCGSRTSCSWPARSWPPRPRPPERLEEGVSKVTTEMVERLEADIDRYMDRVELPPKFVIPGGTELSARLDVARAVVRRAERRVSALKDSGELADDTVLTYLNRASDAVYAMARFADEDSPRAVPGKELTMRAVARRVRTDPQAPRRDRRPSPDRRRAGRPRRHRRGPQPAGAAGREPGLLQRDHDGDVRQPQGLGHRRGGRGRGLRARRSAARPPSSGWRCSSRRSCPRSSARS